MSPKANKNKLGCEPNSSRSKIGIRGRLVRYEDDYSKNRTSLDLVPSATRFAGSNGPFRTGMKIRINTKPGTVHDGPDQMIS